MALATEPSASATRGRTSRKATAPTSTTRASSRTRRTSSASGAAPTGAATSASGSPASNTESSLERLYEQQLLAAGERAYQTQCTEPFAALKRANPRSRPRADFCWPAEKLIVEIDGLGGKKNSHTSWDGYTRNMKKQNAAIMAGWDVLRFTGKMTKEGEGIALTLAMLEHLRGTDKHLDPTAE